MLRAVRPVVALGAVALLVAACGGGGGGDSTSKRAPSTTAPATHGVVDARDNGRRWSTHHRGAVEVAVAVVP